MSNTSALSFESITARLGDIQTPHDRLIAEQVGMQLPFGVELLTDTGESAVRLGSLACVKNEGTQVDDVVIETTGNDGPPVAPDYNNHKEEVVRLN